MTEDEEFTEVREWLEEGFRHGNPGRSPDRPDYRSENLEDAYDDRSTVRKRGEEAHNVLTSGGAKAGSGLVAAAGLIDSVYNPVNTAIAQYPEAATAAVVGASGVLVYNAADYVAETLSSEENQPFPVSEYGFRDLEREFDVSEVEGESEQLEREFEERSQDFDPEEAEILDSETREQLSTMPGELK